MTGLAVIWRLGLKCSGQKS